MKNKQFALFSLSVLILLVLAGFASATATVTATITGTTGSSFDIENSVKVADKLGNIATIALTPTSGSVPATITATITDIESDFGLGTFTKTFPAGTDATLTVKVENNACKYKLGNNLDIDVEDIQVVRGFGDETEWYPLDEVEVRVNIANNGDENIKSIGVNWELYDQTTQTKIISGEEDSFSLNDGDEKELVINFKLDKISKLKTDGDYIFHVWATGDDKSIDSGDDTVCSSTTNEDSGEDQIRLMIDDNFVTISSVSISDVTAVACGNQIQITGEAWNIGQEDEQDVYFKVYNTELGINQKVELGDIDSLDNKDFSFTLNIPASAEEKTYDLGFVVFNEDDDIFENDNDDESRVFIPLEVTGCSTEASALITADLDSEAVAGKELVIKATITNTDSKANTFTLGLDGYTEWASLENIDPTSITVNAGESKEVSIKLKVNGDVSGEQKFNIVVKDGEKVLSQPVSIPITKPSLFNFGQMFSATGGNSYLYGIIGLNVLLVLIIVFVAVKISKKKKSVSE